MNRLEAAFVAVLCVTAVSAALSIAVKAQVYQTLPSVQTSFSGTTCTGCTMTGPTTLTGTTTLNGTAIPAVLTAVTSAIGGGLLAAGGCTSGAVTVTGATVGMAAVANPTTYPGDGIQWQPYVSAANTVTVKVCAVILGTPGSTTYNVRVVG